MVCTSISSLTFFVFSLLFVPILGSSNATDRFVFPASAGPMPTYTAGSQVQLQWLTEYADVSLLLYQGANTANNENYVTVFHELPYGNSNQLVSYTWDVSVYNFDLEKGHMFYFELTNATNTQRSHFTSRYFSIQPPLTPQGTSASSKNGALSSGATIGIGVGVGGGVGSLALAAALILCFRRRSHKRLSAEPNTEDKFIVVDTSNEWDRNSRSQTPPFMTRAMPPNMTPARTKPFLLKEPSRGGRKKRIYPVDSRRYGDGLPELPGTDGFPRR